MADQQQPLLNDQFNQLNQGHQPQFGNPQFPQGQNQQANPQFPGQRVPYQYRQRVRPDRPFSSLYSHITIQSIDQWLQNKIIPYWEKWLAYHMNVEQQVDVDIFSVEDMLLKTKIIEKTIEYPIGKEFPQPEFPFYNPQLHRWNDPEQLFENIQKESVHPLIKCEPYKALKMFFANLFLNPLGTFLGIFYQEKMSMPPTIIFVFMIQLIITWITGSIPYNWGQIINIINIIYGLWLSSKTYYLNIVRKRLEQAQRNPQMQQQIDPQSLVQQHSNPHQMQQNNPQFAQQNNPPLAPPQE